MPMHPFDQALVLERQAGEMFLGHTSPAYWNMIGPFGGITAAVALNAVMQHSARLGEPIALTVNYASALGPGPFTVTARAARTNRSTQHWVIEVFQPDNSGGQQTVLTGSAVTAVRRDTWSGSDMTMPPVLPPQDIPRQLVKAPIEWVNRYELRVVSGKIPRHFDRSVRTDAPETASLTQLWMRDDPPRVMDFCSLAAFADVFYPRVYLRRATRVPVGTVSMTVYFHASGTDLQTCGDAYVFGQARGQVYHNGFFDQSAQLWSESGRLLVTSSQIVYYKE